MPKDFKAALHDPRVVFRAILGVLLAANLAAAVLAFRPFGGSADDLRRRRTELQSRLSQLQARLSSTQQLVNKVETARKQGDEFLTRYVFDGLADAVKSGRLGRDGREIDAIRVTVGESPTARAWYEGALW